MKELLTKYPKASKIVKDYYLEKLIESLNDRNLPDDFKDHVREQGVNDDMIIKILEESPKNLTDVFDENEIYIDIDVHVTMNTKETLVNFSYHIPGVDRDELSVFKTRKEAEKAAVSETFKLLEEKLCL